MKLKNSSSAFITLIAVVFAAMSSFFLTACSGTSYVDSEINKNINVFDVKLNMSEDEVSKLVGASGESTPCIYGYEIAYDSKKVNIGFKNETKTCRRVTTENPSTSIYGIKPGISVEKAYSLLEKTQFVKDKDSKYRFRYKDMLLSLISTDGKSIKGISVEMTDTNQ